MLIIKGEYQQVLSSEKPITKSGLSLAQIALNIYGDFYIDLSKNVIFNKTTFKGRDFLVKTDIKDISWEITDEKKTIGNYLCTKAVTKHIEVLKNGKAQEKQVIAWFAEDYALLVAPQGYYGLPGLVVELESGGFIYSLKEIVEKKMNFQFKINENKAISAQEYLQKRIDYRKR